ncbi:hypothetical protein IT399_00725 [Candidatus Nomurabacteria bacterium]|nr:hypothetical protein [Candidatus Nomurabacteria bacterium]
MKTLRRKVKIGVNKYKALNEPLSAEEEKQLADFMEEINKYKNREVLPRVSVIEKFTKSQWFPKYYEQFYEPL